MNVTMSDTGEAPASKTALTEIQSGAGIIGGIRTGLGPGPMVMAADTIEGSRVLNFRDDYIGKIRDVMIDVPTGRVAYAILSSGSVLGFGGRLYAIPWAAFVVDADRHCFLLNVDEERLRNAPGFDKEAWPEMADPVWAAGVYEYYSIEPYW